jgi:hypothetical protein
MNPRIKLLPRTTYARLAATGTREELLQALAPYVRRLGGRPATGRKPQAEYQRAYRERKKNA